MVVPPQGRSAVWPDVTGGSMKFVLQNAQYSPVQPLRVTFHTRPGPGTKSARRVQPSQGLGVVVVQ